jgi:predicted RNA-binding Zn-ribbon protein involved in translation (DUF1610 family)
MPNLSCSLVDTNVKQTNRCCPNCKSMYLDRVGRRLVDQITSLIVPVKRYYCESCGWRGNLKSKSDQA